MSVKRYSGSCVVTIELVEDHDLQIPGQSVTYRCKVYDRKSRDRIQVMVGRQMHLTRAIDCSEAFDDVAKSALEVADDDAWTTFYPAWLEDGSDRYIGRSKDKAKP